MKTFGGRILLAILAILLAAIFSLITPAHAAIEWVVVVQSAAKQVVRLEQLGEGGRHRICSGVVIDRARGFVLTAAHCVAKPAREDAAITVNKRHAELVRVNTLLDLAVVKTALRSEEQIELAAITPPIGTDVAVVGYAFGDRKLIAQFGRIAQALNDDTNLIFINADVMGGDSGGALIDVQGRLVGITSAVYFSGPGHLGAAVRIEDVREFAEPYLPAKKP